MDMRARMIHNAVEGPCPIGVCEQRMGAGEWGAWSRCAWCHSGRESTRERIPSFRVREHQLRGRIRSGFYEQQVTCRAHSGLSCRCSSARSAEPPSTSAFFEILNLKKHQKKRDSGGTVPSRHRRHKKKGTPTQARTQRPPRRRKPGRPSVPLYNIPARAARGPGHVGSNKTN